MFERFTVEARATVERALEWARDTSAGEVRPEHLLHALLDARTGSRVLAACDVDPVVVRRELDRRRLRYVDGLDEDDAEALAAIGIDLDEVVRRIDRNLGAGPSRRPPRFSRPAKEALELALREAVRLHDKEIGGEHLLLGLARVEDRVVRDTLAAVSLDPAAIRQAVVAARVSP